MPGLLPCSGRRDARQRHSVPAPPRGSQPCRVARCWCWEAWSARGPTSGGLLTTAAAGSVCWSMRRGTNAVDMQSRRPRAMAACSSPAARTAQARSTTTCGDQRTAAQVGSASSQTRLGPPEMAIASLRYQEERPCCSPVSTLRIRCSTTSGGQAMAASRGSSSRRRLLGPPAVGPAPPSACRLLLAAGTAPCSCSAVLPPATASWTTSGGPTTAGGAGISWSTALRGRRVAATRCWRSGRGC
mmetsp:Transcript_115602/g.323247  ORF Transcript_115602/g.323247 Transcript_115602/m.323247 type:complete len:243 (-) Transcript_115602:9-737(-)